MEQLQTAEARRFQHTVCRQQLSSAREKVLQVGERDGVQTMAEQRAPKASKTGKARSGRTGEAERLAAEKAEAERLAAEKAGEGPVGKFGIRMPRT